MSVLVKGMEMPISCGECCFFAWAKGIGQHCNIDSSITFHATMDGLNVSYERKGDCPLIAIPPHGDLIDYDFCVENYELLHDDDGNPVYAVRMRDINNAPTIIPAEEETE